MPDQVRHDYLLLVLAPGSWLLAPGSWLLAPGSWLLAPNIRCYVLGRLFSHSANQPVSLLPFAFCLTPVTRHLSPLQLSFSTINE